MKIVKSLILIILLSAFSCDEEDKCDLDTCGVKNPEEDIAWIKELITAFDSDETQAKILFYRYNDADVFLVDPCVQCADGLATVYDCDKNTLCEFGGIDGRNTCPDFETEAIFIETIYDR